MNDSLKLDSHEHRKRELCFPRILCTTCFH